MVKEHQVEAENTLSEFVEIFMPFIVGDSRAFNVVNTDNFKDFLENFVEKL